MTEPDAIIDDLSRPHPWTPRGTAWQLLTDGVMGGVSTGHMARERVGGRLALRMTGAVRLENDGGFVQMALDLAPGGAAVDASGWRGLAFRAFGQGEAYNVHVRTSAVTRPWQSFRQGFVAGPSWSEVVLPFDGFTAYRLDAAFDPGTLRRIGIVAIGRAFSPDLAVADLRFV